MLWHTRCPRSTEYGFLQLKVRLNTVLAHRMVEAVTRVINSELLHHSTRLFDLTCYTRWVNRLHVTCSWFQSSIMLNNFWLNQLTVRLNCCDLLETGDKEQGRVDKSDKKQKTMRKFGIYFSPEQHIEKALKLPHHIQLQQISLYLMCCDGISSIFLRLAWPRWQSREQTFWEGWLSSRKCWSQRKVSCVVLCPNPWVQSQRRKLWFSGGNCSKRLSLRTGRLWHIIWKKGWTYMV